MRKDLLAMREELLPSVRVESVCSETSSDQRLRLTKTIDILVEVELLGNATDEAVDQ